jgi:hypothetical protein
MPIYMNNNLNQLSLNFRPTGAIVPVLGSEVRGFAADEPTQEDIDATAAALEQLYHELPAGQQKVLAAVLDQAADAE